MKRLVEQSFIQIMDINEQVEVSTYNIIKIGDLIKLSANIEIKQNIENQLIIKFENENENDVSYGFATNIDTGDIYSIKCLNGEVKGSLSSGNYQLLIII